jgi:hypothetical protein
MRYKPPRDILASKELTIIIKISIIANSKKLKPPTFHPSPPHTYLTELANS